MKQKILVVGSLNMDVVVKMNAMPTTGETVLGEELSYIPGGKGANQTCAIGKMGGDVVMLGSIGDDNFGNIQRTNLSRVGVDASRLKVSKKQPTGTAVIFVDDSGNNSIVVIPGANQECSVEYVKQNEELIQKCSYVVLQMEIPFATIQYTIEKAKEYGKTVVLNPAPAPEYIPNALYAKIDYITPNETELMKLTGVKDDTLNEVKRGARILLDKGVANVLVTLGEQGVLLVNHEKECVYEARKTNAVDTTAAGDCFNGTFVEALSEGMNIGEAVCIANIASSIAVSRNGAQTSIPDKKEVLELMKK